MNKKLLCLKPERRFQCNGVIKSHADVLDTAAKALEDGAPIPLSLTQSPGFPKRFSRTFDR